MPSETEIKSQSEQIAGVIIWHLSWIFATWERTAFVFKVEERGGKTGAACRWCSAGSEGRRLWHWQCVLLVNTTRKENMSGLSL